MVLSQNYCNCHYEAFVPIKGGARFPHFIGGLFAEDSGLESADFGRTGVGAALGNVWAIIFQDCPGTTQKRFCEGCVGSTR